MIISQHRKRPKRKTSPSTKISWETLWLEILALAGRRGGRTQLVRPFFLPIQPTFRFDEHSVQVSRRYRELRSPSYKVKLKTIFNGYWVAQFKFLSKYIQTQERNHPQGGHWLWESGQRLYCRLTEPLLLISDFLFYRVEGLLEAKCWTRPMSMHLCYEHLKFGKSRGETVNLVNIVQGGFLTGQFRVKKTSFEQTVSKLIFLGQNMLVRPHGMH